MLPHAVQESAAWLDLSGVGVKLLLHLMKLSEGNNGWGHKDEPGQLFLGEREAAAAIGVSRNTVSRAFDELIDHGFVRVVRAGHFDVKIKLATVWRLTFQPYPRAHQGPTNEWRDWKPAEKKSRAQKSNGSGSKIGHNSENDAITGAETEPDKNKNGGNPPIPVGSKTAPHLDVPKGVLSPEALKRSKSLDLDPSFRGGPTMSAEEIARMQADPEAYWNAVAAAHNG